MNTSGPSRISLHRSQTALLKLQSVRHKAIPSNGLSIEASVIGSSNGNCSLGVAGNAHIHLAKETKR